MINKVNHAKIKNRWPPPFLQNNKVSACDFVSTASTRTKRNHEYGY